MSHASISSASLPSIIFVWPCSFSPLVEHVFRNKCRNLSSVITGDTYDFKSLNTLDGINGRLHSFDKTRRFAIDDCKSGA